MLTSRAITLFHSLLLLKYQCILKYTFLKFAVDHVDNIYISKTLLYYTAADIVVFGKVQE